MFAIDDILISDDLLEAPFSCNLGACLGGCCVQGEAGAPLEPEEREILDKALPRVLKYLTPDALDVIERDGVWEEVAPDEFSTTCVDNRDCVFVTYEGPIAKCALQKAHLLGRLDFPKPISCHLFPVRIQNYGDVDVLNYEQIPLCDPARKQGRRHHVPLMKYLREPLIRKYGEAWYQKFEKTCEERLAALGVASQ